MLARLALLLVLILPQVVSAEEVAVILDSGKPGTFLLTVGADGSVTVSPLRVIRPGPGPNPPPPPNPDTLTERGKLVKAAAEKVTGDADRSTTAMGLAALYREVAKLVRTPGAVKDQASLTNGLKVGTDTLLSSRGVLTQWQPVRDVFATEWTKLQARSAPLGDYATLLDEAATGLDASVPPAQRHALPPEFWKFLLEVLLPILLKLLFPT